MQELKILQIQHDVDWLTPWEVLPPDQDVSRLKRWLFGHDYELAREVGPVHPLWKYRKKALPIACRCDCDDRLYYLPGRSPAFAVVHLTWAGLWEKFSNDHPNTTFYDSLDDWINNCMNVDNREYINAQ